MGLPAPPCRRHRPAHLPLARPHIPHHLRPPRRPRRRDQATGARHRPGAGAAGDRLAEGAARGPVARHTRLRYRLAKRSPVVFAIVTDPVALGLVAALDRPGRNATGLTSLDPQQAGAQITLLREVLP